MLVSSPRKVASIYVDDEDEFKRPRRLNSSIALFLDCLSKFTNQEACASADRQKTRQLNKLIDCSPDTVVL